MRLWITIAMLPMLATTAACQSKWEKEGGGGGIPANGAGATRNYAVTGFTGVDLKGSDNVDIKTGATFSVTAEGNPKVLDQLEIQVVDGILRIGRKNNSGTWFDHDNGAQIHVVMPALNRARVSGSGNLVADHAEGNVEAAITGSGDLDIADLKGGATTLSVAGSGDLSVKGAADKLSASIAGSGDIIAGSLIANSADISIAGSGGLRGTVKGPASISIVGSGDVELVGGAKCSISAVGSGEARCS